ncbi:glycosyltransferase family 4 protein [Thiohalobacter thiocyanaticus]|uniref:Glycosyltransferase n=1 Tax=Thiohalobacter thiocyanaticus TaxID=585455 RepID=A0A426QN21_9GAMM|nr:glycosyltransferase family 4 protein [Thiohalobacter thiocyanaticus]RRQ23066.1 glycosyltransferase [Thiohalobacter thiocyanaticus]
MKRIVIVQRRLTHYRVPLFTALKEALAARDIQLELLVGHGTSTEEKKHDAGILPWARSIPTHYWLADRLCWQSIGKHLHGADLVITTQENKLLQNHLLMFMPRRFKLAFWGHGANLQSGNPNGFKERFKRWTTNQVDWWFAYTELSASLVKAAGFPGDRITVVNNAVDTSELQRQRQSVTPEETQALRASLGFSTGPVGVYLGSLYADKRLDFLFAAAEAIRHQVHDFHLLILGEGPERHRVQAWCGAHPWARWVGARFDREKVAYMSVAKIMLNPGAVGLGVMDAFVCMTPMITTECGSHGPEITYIKSGINGMVTANELSAYVDTSVRLLRDARLLGALRTGCATSAQEYTVENMARRFTNGIEYVIGR